MSLTASHDCAKPDSRVYQLDRREPTNLSWPRVAPFVKAVFGLGMTGGTEQSASRLAGLGRGDVLTRHRR